MPAGRGFSSEGAKGSDNNSSIPRRGKRGAGGEGGHQEGEVGEEG